MLPRFFHVVRFCKEGRWRPPAIPAGCGRWNFNISKQSPAWPESVAGRCCCRRWGMVWSHPVCDAGESRRRERAWAQWAAGLLPRTACLLSPGHCLASLPAPVSSFLLVLLSRSGVIITCNHWRHSGPALCHHTVRSTIIASLTTLWPLLTSPPLRLQRVMNPGPGQGWQAFSYLQRAGWLICRAQVLCETQGD